MPDNSYAIKFREEANKLQDIATMLECMFGNPQNYTLAEIIEYFTKNKKTIAAIVDITKCYTEIIRLKVYEAEYVGLRDYEDDGENMKLTFVKDNILYLMSPFEKSIRISGIYPNDAVRTGNIDYNLVTKLTTAIKECNAPKECEVKINNTLNKS